MVNLSDNKIRLIIVNSKCNHDHKNTITIRYNNSISGYISKRTESRNSNRYTGTPMVIAALFTIAKRWKQLKCLSMDAWKNKMWYTHTMKYYLALKRKKILTSYNMNESWGQTYIKWNKPITKRWILYDSIVLIWGIQNSQIQRDKVEWQLPGARGREEWSCCLTGIEFLFCKMKRVLKTCCTTTWIYSWPLNNEDLNCIDLLLCGIFFNSIYYNTTWNEVGWILECRSVEMGETTDVEDQL